MKVSESLRKRTRRLIIEIGKKVIFSFEKVLVKFSRVGDVNFFDPKQFEWAARLEANWMVIRNELEALLKYREHLPNFQDVSIDQSRISNDDKWKTYFFYGFGYKDEKNCARCPETTKLIESVPGMKTALFSILSPQKHIPEHRGVYKGLLRYHLGLIVPEPKQACRLRVGNDFVHWEEGKSLLFDDTFQHEVWNDTEGERAVLFMDVVRPFRFPMSFVNLLIIKLIGLSPYVQDGIKNAKKWQQGFDLAIKKS